MSTVLYTTVRSNQRVSNSFKLVRTSKQTQGYSNTSSLTDCAVIYVAPDVRQPPFSRILRLAESNIVTILPRWTVVKAPATTREAIIFSRFLFPPPPFPPSNELHGLFISAGQLHPFISCSVFFHEFHRLFISAGLFFFPMNCIAHYVSRLSVFLNCIAHS